MRPIFQAFALALYSMLGGCISVSRPQEDPAVLLNSTPVLENSLAFQKVVGTTPNTPAYERARIDYLLDRLARSPYDFVRNRMTYSGKKAASHLRWKYLRHRRESPTAEAFIEHIATGSRTTGERYLVKMGGKTHSFRGLLRNELKSLDAGVEGYRTHASHEMLKKQGEAADNNEHNGKQALSTEPPER